MNYDLFLTENGITQKVIEDQKVSSEFRPRIGDIMSLKGYPNRQFKVIRSVPSDNPATQKVSYYLQPFIGANTAWPQDQINSFYWT